MADDTPTDPVLPLHVERLTVDVALRRVRDSHDETISDTVRRTEVEVDKDSDDPTGLTGATRRDRSALTEEEAEMGISDEDDISRP